MKNRLSDLTVNYKMFRWSLLFKSSTYWIIPTVIFVYCFYRYENILIIDSKYIENALNEAISPFLWNFLGVIGFFACGLSILSISHKISVIFSKIAHKMLSMTYEMGFLIIGIMAGKLILDFKLATMPIWQKWFYGVNFSLLFFIVFVLNSMLWLFDEIIINIETKQTKAYELIDQLKNKPKWISICLGTIIIVLSIFSLIYKRII